MNITLLIIILFAHWFLDFVCQSTWMANNKSEIWKALFTHSGIYCTGMMITIFTYNYNYLNLDTFSLIFSTLGFGIITFLVKTLSDAITATFSRKVFRKQEYRKFFNIIGFGQFIHIVQLTLTYILVT